jgi:hypothetical protein
MKQIQALYMKQGFCIKEALMDGQFECIRADLASMGIQLNVVSGGKHVPKVECYIRTIKERVRCIFNNMPFARVPALVVTKMVKSSLM